MILKAVKLKIKKYIKQIFSFQHMNIFICAQMLRAEFKFEVQQIYKKFQ